MSWMDRVGGLLKQYSSGSGTGAAAQPAPDVNAHFDQVAQAAPQSTIGEGLAGVLRSGSAGSFGEAVSKLFAQSDSNQKAGLLQKLAGAGNSGVVSKLLSAAGLSGAAASNPTSITPQQAQNVPPNTVQELATHAQQNRASIVDEVSHFYAQHPMVVKTLGAAAISVLLSKVAERHRP